MWRSLYLTFAILCGTSQALSQLPLSRTNGPVDLFEIGTSRSLFASKGIKPISTDPPAVGGRESRKIISDLAEAIEVIRSNHVAGRAVDLDAITKSAISGALQTLDP